MGRNVHPVTVPTAGPTVSATLDLQGSEAIVGIQLSSTFDGTTLTVTGDCAGASALVPVRDIYGNAVVLTISDDSAGFYYLDPVITFGLSKVAFLSNAAQSAGAGETIYVVTVGGI